MNRTVITIENHKWVASPLFAFLCITFIGVLIYGNTLNATWYFDDIQNIVRNPVIRDLPHAWGKILNQRGLAIFSFALNYRIHGLNLPGYHITNIVIHLLTTFFVYLSLKRVFRNTPVLALLSALIFLAHPLQTQSVTYIVQRMTSLSGLFFFLTIYLYIRAREALSEGKSFFSAPHLFFYLISIFTGAVAIFTKENAAILPFSIFLFDRFFMPRQKQNVWWLILYMLPYFAAPAWMALSKLVIPIIDGKGLRDVTSTTDPAKSIQISKEADFSYLLSYLVTEFSVLWLYIRLLFLPYGQALDYQYPLVNSLITIKNVAALFGLGGLFSIAWFVRIRQPFVSFAILWFFITLSVESTIIPLDPVFEHRLYVPMFGFALLLPQILKWICPEKPKYLVIIVIIVVYGILTWNRNELWSNETAFYEDQIKKVPHGTRIMVGVSKIYIDSKRYTEAEVLLRKAILIDPGTEKAYVNLTSLMVKNNRMEEALQIFQQGLKANPNSRELYNNLGVFYNLVGKQDLAIQSLLKSISIPPPYAEAYTNLGVVYADMKRWEDAERCYRLGISVLYENPKAHFNLGVALFSTGRMAEAAEAFKITLKFAPLDSWALYNLACVYIELGNGKAALDILPGLRKIDSQLSNRLENELAKQSYTH